MPDEDFGIDSLAAYLHLMPEQVLKLVDRGKLPGRKVGGDWRFSPPEIHHWLENRIGLSDDGELARMEQVLSLRGAESSIAVAELLPPELMAVPLAARTKGKVITELVDRAAHAGWLWDAARMAEAVRFREDMHPTALDNGVALLHARRPLPAILDRAFLAYGRSEHGIPFGSRGLTDIFFLICSTEDRGHLRVLARLSRLIGDPAILSALRQAPDAATTHDLLAKAEQEL